MGDQFPLSPIEHCVYSPTLRTTIMKTNCLVVLFVMSRTASAFWDFGTTTLNPALARWDAQSVRQSRFRWQRAESTRLAWWYSYWDWTDLNYRRRLCVVAGISIAFINLTTAAILNRRTLITSANPIDPYLHRVKELRIWALGRTGQFNTPWRYRVWRVTRLFPKSSNDEHCHGPYCTHSPRHDVAVIHSWDQMYVEEYMSYIYQYAVKTFIPGKKQTLDKNDLWFAGSGYEYIQHIHENYKIFYTRTAKEFVVDCSKFLPKWWGKFICLLNHNDVSGVQNGGPLFDSDYVVGIGCFDIRYNEDRVIVFTDLRYYVDWINYYGYVFPGEYYEYAYPQWHLFKGFWGYSSGNQPYFPSYKVQWYGLYPLG